ncbi:MAG: phosphatase PAP2 family protein [Gemmatimonadaceae bacterium]
MSGVRMGRSWLAGSLSLVLITGPAACQLRPEDDRFWALAAITLLGTAATDQQLADALRGPGPPVLRSTADLVEPLGRAQVGLVGLGASYAAARLAHQPAWARATLHVAAGFVAASSATGVLKPIVDRARPEAGLGTYAFHDGRAGEHHHAFPSGHATHAFALAAGIAEEAHQRWVTAAAYGAATLVAWSRVHDEAHWPSDVIAGAVVGTSASLTTIAWLERGEERRRPRGADAGAPRRAETNPDERARTTRVWVSPAAITVSIRF